MSKESLSKFLTKNGVRLRSPRPPRNAPEVDVKVEPQKLIPRISDLRSPSGRPDSWDPTREEKKLLLDSRPEIFDVEKPKKKGRQSKGSKTRSVIKHFTCSAEEEKLILAYVKEQNKGLSEIVRIALFAQMGRCIPDRYV